MPNFLEQTLLSNLRATNPPYYKLQKVSRIQSQRSTVSSIEIIDILPLCCNNVHSLAVPANNRYTISGIESLLS